MRSAILLDVERSYEVKTSAGKYWNYFNPNPRNSTKASDCTIRAVCAVTDLSWYEVFDKLVALARENCTIPNSKSIRADRMKLFNLKKITLPKVKRGGKRPTVETWCKQHPTGKYILGVSKHEVGVVNGKYYDTWRSGDYSVYSAWELEA